jgi:hypothetical protein
MKTMFVALAAALLAFTALTPAPAQPEKNSEPKPEALPDFPKLDPSYAVTAVNPEKTIFAEIADKSVKRVGLACEICLREGPLELFLCKKGTKEHEAIVSVDADARFIHTALTVARAKHGKPTQFINPKTDMAEWKPATGSKIKVSVHYTIGGKKFTHPAQDWIWDMKKKAPMPHHWVFAGSMIIVDPDTKREFYAANSGDIIGISNFPYAMLEIPVEISKDDAQLTYEARTEKLPPLYSKVWVLLEPELEK